MSQLKSSPFSCSGGANLEGLLAGLYVKVYLYRLSPVLAIPIMTMKTIHSLSGGNIQFLEIRDEMKENQTVRDDFGFAVSIALGATVRHQRR